MKRTSSRPGYADIRLFGVQWSVCNFHASKHDMPWTTGIYTDGWRRTDGSLTWYFDIIVLGFGIGACS